MEGGRSGAQPAVALDHNAVCQLAAFFPLRKSHRGIVVARFLQSFVLGKAWSF